jgi:hypothetical protein
LKRPPPRRFDRAALRLAKVLGPEDCRLAGALAVAAHGFVRATKDVDLVTRLPLPEVKRRLTADGVMARLIHGDALEGDFSTVRGELDRVPFDILPPLVAIDWDRGVPALQDRSVRLFVVSLENLLALKLKAQGPKDLLDAAMLVLLHPEVRPHALELSEAYRVRDRFVTWLEDPRLGPDVRDQRAAAIRARRGGR